MTVSAVPKTVISSTDAELSPRTASICPGFLPAGGGIVLLAADTEHGKSPLAYRAVAACTALIPFVPGVPPTFKAPKRAVVFNAEDTRNDVEQRLVGAGADMSRVIFYNCVVERPDIRLEHVAQLMAEAVRKHPDIGLVVVDPLHAFVRVQCQSFTVRQHYGPFHQLPANHGVTVLFPHHTVKGAGRIRIPLDLAAGSKGWAQFAPMVWQIVRAQDEDYFILEMTKGRKIADKPAREYWCESWEKDVSVPVGVIGGPAALRIGDILNQGGVAQCKFEEAKATIRSI